MLKDDTKSNWTARIAASLAMVVALSGGLWLSDKASGGTEPATATAIATSCTKFNADAGKLFDNGDRTALTGTFARGDHVHLIIDFKGAGYSWELTGALGKTPDVTGTGPFSKYVTYTYSKPADDNAASTPSTPAKLIMSRGTISGFARLDLELDVASAGEGAITINRTGSVPSFARVAIASCKAAIQPTT
jgi:hypothetical protein